MEQLTGKKRIEWVDILKGIAIISVIIGHRSADAGLVIPKILRVWIYSWHIPLFFFLSGVVFSIDKYNNFKSFLIKKAKTILIPMVAFSFIRIVFNYVYYYLILGYQSYNMSKMCKRFIGIILQLRNSDYAGYLWFLNCLFITQILLYFIIKLTKNNSKYILCAVFSTYILGAVWINCIGVQLPWYLELSLIANVFVSSGYLMKCHKDKILPGIHWFVILIAFVVNVVSTYCNYIVVQENVDLVVNQIGNPVLYLLESLSGIIVIVGLFKNASNLRLISYIGRNSLVYYCLIDLMAFIPDIIVYNILHLNYIAIGNAILLVWVGYVIVICVSIYPLNELIRKKGKILLGNF